MTSDLQAARREAAKRYYAIAMAALPEGWTYKFRRSLTGRSWPYFKHIDAPKPVTRKALYIWLHECAHAHLHGPKCRKQRFTKEFEAELWAHDKMREAGVAVPKVMTERAKDYVKAKLQKAVKRKAAIQNRHAAHWARFDMTRKPK
jgi:hypothetical protein